MQRLSVSTHPSEPSPEPSSRSDRDIAVWAVALYSLIVSALLLLLCTKSSPLYPLNDWVDANAFFTMGKGMMNGLVPYRDLFEQKGPLVYALHGFAYLLSERTFLGVYLLETLSFAAFLYFIHKILTLFVPAKYSLLSLPAFAAIILNMTSFTHGDSVEELSFPLLAAGIYTLLLYFKDRYPEPIPYRWLLWNGAAAGCVLWIKYSLLGFWFGWMAFLFFAMVIGRHYAKAFVACGVFLGGMLIATLPWLLYFGLNGAIAPWLDTYIWTNFRYYGKDLSAIDTVYFILDKFRYNLTENPVFAVFCLLSVGFVCSNKWLPPLFGRISIVGCVALLTLGVYGGGQGILYYFLIFAPFMVFGWIVALSGIRRLVDRRLTLGLSAVVSGIVLALSLLLTFLFNHNVYLLKVAKADMVQYRFAGIIEQTPDASLLNYGNLDRGLYTTTGIVPQTRFFQKQNFDYDKFPLVMDEQRRYIRERAVDYVLVCVNQDTPDPDATVPDELEMYYSAIASQTQMFEGSPYLYTLYQLKN